MTTPPNYVFPTLFPSGYYVTAAKIQALPDIDAKIADLFSISILYLIDTAYYAGRTVSSLIQLPCSLFFIAVLLVAPTNTMLERATAELSLNTDGFPALLTNACKVIICAATAFAIPFCSPRTIKNFYAYCSSDSSSLSTAVNKPSTEKEIPLSKLHGVPEEVTKICSSMVSRFKHPERAAELGLEKTFPTLLFSGPPGTGKTEFAKAIAAELREKSGKNIFFKSVRMSDLASKWLNATAGKINELNASFAEAAKKGDVPVLFIDEIDMGMPNREGNSTSSTFEGAASQGAALAAFLKLIEDLKGMGGIFLAATNQPQNLDPSIKSRFDETVSVPLPTPGRSLQILRGFLVTLGQKWVAPDLLKIGTPQGAEIEAQLAPFLEGLSIRDIKSAFENAKNQLLRNPYSLLNHELLIEKLRLVRTKQNQFLNKFSPSTLLGVLDLLLKLKGSQVLTTPSSETIQDLNACLAGLSNTDVINATARLPNAFGLNDLFKTLLAYRVEKKLPQIVLKTVIT